MRVAWVDLMFSWPPHGGADVDAYHVLTELQRLGHKVLLVGCWSAKTWERGDFDPDDLPFPARRADFRRGIRDGAEAVDMIARPVEGFAPDVVVVGDSFFLKPRLILRLGKYPLAARLYAYETLCHKDILRFLRGAPCPNSFLRTPDVCRACGAEHQRGWIQTGHPLAWTEEYVAATAYAPDYHTLTLQALNELTAAMVYNEQTAEAYRGFVRRVEVVPGAVDTRAFEFAPPNQRGSRDKKVVLMTGRGEDPVKGADVLMAAGEILACERDDFVVKITAPETTDGPAWFEALPWCDHAATRARYVDADIVVVPSIWEEPFGMVALEAMATGRPVCVSQVGGLQHTIAHGVSGFRFQRGNPRELACYLRTLLDDATTRERMGAAARKRVEREFTWGRIVRTRVEPLLLECAKRAKE